MEYHWIDLSDAVIYARSREYFGEHGVVIGGHGPSMCYFMVP